MIETIGMVATVVAAFLTFYWFSQKRNNPITVQDLIGKIAEVSPSGIVRNGNMFRTVIEVRPVNMMTSSKMEQDSVWVNFRALVNTLGIPYTLLVQSQFVDMKDYTHWYREQFNTNSFLTKELKESGEGVIRHIHRNDEEKKTRDFRCYVILKYDPIAESIDSGVKTGSFLLDDLIEKVTNRQSKMSNDEIKDLAYQVLQEATQLVFSACDQLGMQYRRLDRPGIYDMIYTTLQKELSSNIRLSDAMQAKSFTAHIESVTSRMLAYDYQESKEV
jgi:hypothetical protein